MPMLGIWKRKARRTRGWARSAYFMVGLILCEQFANLHQLVKTSAAAYRRHHLSDVSHRMIVMQATESDESKALICTMRGVKSAVSPFP